jgi:hypothetical protein
LANGKASAEQKTAEMAGRSDCRAAADGFVVSRTRLTTSRLPWADSGAVLLTKARQRDALRRVGYIMACWLGLPYLVTRSAASAAIDLWMKNLSIEVRERSRPANMTFIPGIPRDHLLDDPVLAFFITNIGFPCR